MRYLIQIFMGQYFSFSNPICIMPLVLFLIGISLIPMSESLFRPEIYKDMILTEQEKEEKFQRCLGYIHSDASVAERTAAVGVCKNILSNYFVGSRVRSSVIDDHVSFIRTCHDIYGLYQAVGELNTLKITTNPKIRKCVELYNDPLWKHEGKERLVLLHKWYNDNLDTGKEILSERDRQIKLELISSLKENFEEEKTIQNDIKPASQEEETIPDEIPEQVDKFDFKPEKQPDVVPKEDDKFCFLFWCW